MANPQVLFDATLDEVTSATNINSKIKTIQGKLDKINLNITIDQNVLNVLKDFSASMERVNTLIDQQNKIIQTHTTILRDEQGNIITETKQLTAAGQTIESTTREINKSTQASQENANAVQKQVEVTQELAKVQKEYINGSNIPSKTTTTLQSPYSSTKQIVTGNDNSKLIVTQDRLKQINDIYAQIANAEKEILTIQADISNVGENEANALKQRLVTLNQIVASNRQYLSENNLNENNVTIKQKELELTNQLQNVQDKLNISKGQELDKEQAISEAEKNRIFNLGNKQDITFTGLDDNSMKQYATAVYGAEAEIVKLDNATIKAGNTMRDMSIKVATADNGFKQLKVTADQTSQAVYTGVEKIGTNAAKDMTIFDQLKVAMERFPIWILASTATMGSIHAVSDMISTISDLDQKMTDLKKVTDESDSSYQQFIKDANQVAIEVGHTTSAAIEATTNFARLGYSLSQAQDLAKQTLIYSNVGDIDVNQASQNLISTIKGFDLNISDTTHIIDAANAVGNKFAITSGGIGDALQRSSAAMSDANNTLEQTIGLITAANNSIQDPEKVGNGLKTISMRLRDIDEESGQAIPKLRETIKTLSGVDIMQNEDTFKSTFEILKEISAVYKSLPDTSKASLLELVGGKQQGQIAASILNNMTDGVNAMQTAVESAGSAAKEQAKYMDSIQGKTNAFRETMTSIASNTISSNFIKDIITVGTGVMSLVNKIGLLPISITAVALAVSIWNKNWNLLNISMTAWGERQYSGILVNIKNALSGLSSETVIATARTVALTLAETALNAALTLGISLLLQGAITGIAALIDNHNKAAQAAKQHAQAEKDAVDAFNQEYDAFKQSPNEEGLNNLQASLDKLKDTTGYDEAITKVKELKQEIADLEEKNKNPNLNGISKAANNSQIYNDQQALGKYQKTVDDVTKSQNDFNNAQKQSQQEANKEAQSLGYDSAAAEDLDKTYKTLQQNYEDSTSTVQELYKIQDELNSKDGISADTYEMMIEKHQELLPYLNNESALRSKLNELIAQQTQVQKSAYQTMLENSSQFFNSEIKGNQTLWNEIAKCYATDYQNFTTVADVKNKVDASLVSVIGKRWSSLYGSEAQALDAAISMTSREVVQVNKLYGGQQAETANALSNQLDTLRQERDIISGLSNVESISLGNINFGKIDLGKISSPSSGGGGGSSSGSGSKSGSSSPASSGTDALSTYWSNEADNFQSKIQPLLNSIDNLESKLQMLPSTDLTNKMKLLSNEVSTQTSLLKDYTKEYSDLTHYHYPAGSEAAKTVADRMNQLNQSINDTKVKINDLNNQFNSAKMDEWNQSFNNSISLLLQYQQTAEATSKMIDTTDYAGQFKNLGDQLSIQSRLLDAYKKQLNDLSHQSFPAGTDAASKLADEIKTLTQNVQESNQSIYSMQNNLVSTFVNAQKAYDQAVLDQEEATMNANISNYEQSLFGGTQDQYEKNITAQNDAIQAQIDALDNQNNALQEQQDLQQKLLDITDAQNKLNNVMNEKNVQELVKDANGQWQYQYVADAKQVEDAQKDLQQKQEDYQKTVVQNQINAQKKALQAEIDNNNKILNAKKQELQDYTTAQQNAYNTDKALFDAHYAQMDALTQATLAKLTSDFTDNWDNIVKAVQTRVSQINSAIASISKVDLSFLNLGAMSGGTRAASTKIPRFATGGYTGDNVPATGALAILDNKELVLNANDSKNILGAAEITKQMANTLKTPNVSNISNNNAKKLYFDHVNINTNITSSKQLKDFFYNLDRWALQYE